MQKRLYEDFARLPRERLAAQMVKPCTLNPTHNTLLPKPYTLYPKPYTLNPQPSTPDPKP